MVRVKLHKLIVHVHQDKQNVLMVHAKLHVLQVAEVLVHKLLQYDVQMVHVRLHRLHVHAQQDKQNVLMVHVKLHVLQVAVDHLLQVVVDKVVLQEASSVVLVIHANQMVLHALRLI